MKFGNRCEGLICACCVIMRCMIFDRLRKVLQSGCQMRATFLTLQLDLGHENETKQKSPEKEGESSHK